ncbi:MAG: segregation/condensation protein A [Acidimicrobiia bacterium]|nr:segregation/condensation protein A [Acidimicrobiia bacterium]
MSYQVATPVFNGPIDLLLQLVSRRHVDVMEVSLSAIIEEFFSLTESDHTDLNLSSEFVLIAAMLIHLKTRFLFPEPEAVDLEEEMALLDRRDRLLARLLSFLTYQDVASVFQHRLQHGSRYVGRSYGIDIELDIESAPILPATVTPDRLAEIMADLTAWETQEAALVMDHLDFDLPSVEDAMADVRVRIADALETTFEELVAHCLNRTEVVAYFLAVLELVRWGLVSVRQEDLDRIAVSPPREDEPVPSQEI